MIRINKGIASLMMLGAIATASYGAVSEGVEVNHLGVNNTLVRVTGESKYLMLPVQESNDDARIEVLVDGKPERTIYVRLAKAKWITASPSTSLLIKVTMCCLTSSPRRTVRTYGKPKTTHAGRT